MIGKLAPRRRGRGVSVAHQIRDLISYIDRADSGADRGDILGLGSMGFVADTRLAQVAEMTATAMGAPRARTPIEHIVLSWRDAEIPDIAQAREAARIVLAEAGLSGHQALWVLHRAEHIHQHIIVNRVAPDASRPAKVAFFHNSIGRAVAQIEHRQGWQREAGARFEYIEGVHVNGDTRRSGDRFRGAPIRGGGGGSGTQGYRQDLGVANSGPENRGPDCSNNRAFRDHQHQARQGSREVAKDIGEDTSGRTAVLARSRNAASNSPTARSARAVGAARLRAGVAAGVTYGQGQFLSPRPQVVSSPEHTYRIAVTARMRAEHEQAVLVARNVVAAGDLRTAITRGEQADIARPKMREVFQKLDVERDTRRSSFPTMEMRWRIAYAYAVEVRGTAAVTHSQSEPITAERDMAEPQIPKAVEESPASNTALADVVRTPTSANLPLGATENATIDQGRFLSPRLQGVSSPEQTHRIAVAAGIRAEHHLEVLTAQNAAAASRLRIAIPSERQVDAVDRAKSNALQTSADGTDWQTSRFAIAEMRLRAADANGREIGVVVYKPHSPSQSIASGHALAVLQIRDAVKLSPVLKRALTGLVRAPASQPADDIAHIPTAIRTDPATHQRAWLVARAQSRCAEQDAAREQTSLDALGYARSDTQSAQVARVVAEATLRSGAVWSPGAVLAATFEPRDTISIEAATVEVRAGVMSAERIAIEIAGPIADRCRSWGELHAELAKEGILYETKGSGAIFKIGKEVVKASTYRKAAIGPLTKRFGSFETAKKQVAARAPAFAPGIGVKTADALAVAKMSSTRHKADLAKADFPPLLARALRQAAPNVRTIATSLGEAGPALTALRHQLHPPNNHGPHCDTLHAALEADFYSILIRQTRSEKRPVNWLVSRPKSEENPTQPWPPMPIPEAEDEDTFIIPHSSSRHFIVLSGLTKEAVSELRKDGIKPAIVVAVGRQCDVLLIAARETNDPDELDAAEETAWALAGRYGGKPTAILRAPGLRPRMAPDLERDTGDQIVAMSAGFCNRVSEMVRHTYAASRRRLRIVSAGLKRNGASLYDVALSEIPARLRRTLAASVVDGLIARRLHAQGQPVAAVIDVIRHHAPLARPARQPVLDWPLYAAWIVDRAVRPGAETSRHLAAQYQQPATPDPASMPRLAATAEPPTSDAAAAFSEAREPGTSAKAVMPAVKRPTRPNRSRPSGGMEM